MSVCSYVVFVFVVVHGSPSVLLPAFLFKLRAFFEGGSRGTFLLPILLPVFSFSYSFSLSLFPLSCALLFSPYYIS